MTKCQAAASPITDGPGAPMILLPPRPVVHAVAPENAFGAAAAAAVFVVLGSATAASAQMEFSGQGRRPKGIGPQIGSHRNPSSDGGPM